MEEKMNEELDLETLDSVVAGVSHEIGENATLSNENLYRRQQIEKLKKEKEALEALGKDSDEMSMDELDNVRVGMSRR